MGAFMAGQSHVFSKFLFQLESPLILVTAPEFLAGDTPTPNVMEIGAFSLCHFFYQSSEWSPMGQKGTSSKFVTRPVCVSS